MLIVAITLIFSGALVTAICLPMVYERIPPNAVYGMRTKHTFRSNEAWYHLNEVGGMVFSMLGFPLMLGGSVGLFLTDKHVALIGTTTAVAALVSMVFAVFLFMRYSIRYTARTEQEAA